MRNRTGWAAFLALGILLLSSIGYSDSAYASNRPIVACFGRQNAELLGRLGPQDETVRYAFELGACLALTPSARISNVARDGNLWRFQAYGARVPLYAPDWGAGVMSVSNEDARGIAFAAYVPLSSRLLQQGRAFTECYDAHDDFARRWDDLQRRWDAYEARRGRALPQTTFVVTLYFADTGLELNAERENLKREGFQLRHRCANLTAMELDLQFMSFVRSASMV